MSVPAGGDESNSIAIGSRENFVLETDTTGPMDKDRYLLLKDRLMAAALDTFSKAWGSRKARLNRTLLGLVEALLVHANFARGGRVAFTVEGLAQALRTTERTVTRNIAKLEDFAELVRVLRLRPGDIAWDGKPTRREHLEWELGPALRSLLDRFADGAHRRAEPLPRHGAADSDTVSPDHLDHSEDLKTLRASAASSRQDRPNFSRQLPVRKPHPRAIPSPTARATSQPAAAVSPGVAKAASMARPSRLEAQVIRQHRRIAEGKGPETPIAPEEVEVVRGALNGLGEGMRDERQTLALCARVSELAVRDSIENGHETASLRFTFAGLEEAPHLWFLQRLSRLREEREKRKRELQDAELAACLLGKPRPLARSKAPQRPSSAGRRRFAGGVVATKSSNPMQPSELAAALKNFVAGQRRARA